MKCAVCGLGPTNGVSIHGTGNDSEGKPTYHCIEHLATNETEEIEEEES